MNQKSHIVPLLLLVALWGCTSTKQMQTADAGKDIYDTAYIKELMKQVTDYQINNLNTETMAGKKMEKVPSDGWIRGAFYTGVMATYQATDDKKYLKNMLDWGNANNWEPGPRKRHADDHTVCQTYIDLYAIKQDPKMIRPTVETFNEIVENPMPGKEVGWSKKKNWSWCDALFMAPPAFAKLSKVTGDEKYLDAMNRMWWETSEYLYDPQDSLYYRDEEYKPNAEGTETREPNNRKVFWGRGNGWVLGGLTKVLEAMPEDYEHRDKFLQQYREMSAKIVRHQHEDGLWRASFYDPESYPAPETSSSSFFTYALIWGVNNNVLPRDKYLPVIRNAWEGLVSAINEEGKIGWVQKVGHDPQPVYKEDTHEYAAGAFLNAAYEMIALQRAIQ